MFPSGFSVEETQKYLHITIQLLLNYCQEHLFVPGLLCIYVRLGCKKKIEQFFIFVLFIYFFLSIMKSK